MATFLTLQGSLPFENSDYSDFEDLLTVPQHGNDFSLSSSSSLEATDLFLHEIGFDGSGETTSSLTSPASDASSRLPSRLEELTSSFSIVLEDADRHQQPESTAALLPLGPHGLKLKLDLNSVMSTWYTNGGANPFQLRGPALATATVAIPSTSDLEASLTAASVPAVSASPAGSAAEPAGPCTDTAEEARQATEAARLREKKASRKSSERKVQVVYPARKVNADKRPRIKGRFVTKAEFQLMFMAQVADDRAVPGLVRA